MRVFIAMKKFLVLFFTFLLAVSVNAQDTHKLKSISLTTGVTLRKMRLTVLALFLMILVIHLG